MSINDDTQVLLQMVALSKRLSAKAGENVTNELISLRQRDQENYTIINRLTKDRGTLLQQSEAAVDENEKLKTDVERLTVAATQAENDLGEHRRSLREATTKVKELEQYRVELKDETEDSIERRWEQLWISVNNLATDYFEDNLDPDTLRSHSDWEPPTSHNFPRKFPAPATNSDEAKQMRIVAVDSIIASALTRHIFRPIGRDDDFVAALSELAASNPDMESFCRSSHFAVMEKLPRYRDSVIDKAVKAAVADVVKSISPILPDATIRQFRIDLEDTCRSAEREWQVFQRCKKRYEVDMDGDKNSYYPVPLWQPSSGNDSRQVNRVDKKSVQDQAGNSQKGKQSSSTERRADSGAIVTSVWPLLRVMEADGANPLFSGWALFWSQAKVAQEQVQRANREAVRSENRPDETKRSPRPLFHAAFGAGSPKST